MRISRSIVNGPKSNIQVWNGIIWKILPAMEDGRFTFHSIVCPGDNQLADHEIRCLHCLQRQVAKLGSGSFQHWSLLRNNNTATNVHFKVR